MIKGITSYSCVGSPNLAALRNLLLKVQELVMREEGAGQTVEPAPEPQDELSARLEMVCGGDES